MNKIYRFFSVFMIFILMILGCSCVSTKAEDLNQINNSSLEMDEETEQCIVNDYLKYINDSNISDEDVIYNYFGIYNDYIIILMSLKDYNETDETIEIPIGEYSFVFYHGTQSERFYAYHNNEFITVLDAYEKAFLLDKDIEQIAENFNLFFESGKAYNLKTDYIDVGEKDWFYLFVKDVQTRNLMTGMHEKYFGAYENISRAQFATILFRMEDKQPVSYDDIFNDVAEGEWYTDAVLWAAENKIVTGYENGCFGPADYITREQMAVMLYRYAEYKGYDTAEYAGLTEYPDVSDVSDFANDAISWCVAKGIISGNDGKLLPQGNTTRAECAAMISRFVDLYE